MKKLITLLLTLACFIPAQAQFLQKQLKFATFYTAVTGNNSLADVSVYSLTQDNLTEDRDWETS